MTTTTSTNTPARTPPTPTPPKRSSSVRPALIVLIVLAIATAIYAVPRYLTGNPADSTIPLASDEVLHYLVLAAHAVPGGVALITGGFQFIPRLRARYPLMHRVVGRVYMISVVISAIVAFSAATFSVDGFAAQVAFYVLGIAWLYSLVQAFVAIRRGEVQLHRVWMIRNYALTFSAVTLRMFLLVGLLVRPAIGVPFTDVYAASVWASIFITALAAEYFIVYRIVAPSLRRRRRSTTGISLSGSPDEGQRPLRAE